MVMVWSDLCTVLDCSYAVIVSLYHIWGMIGWQCFSVFCSLCRYKSFNFVDSLSKQLYQMPKRFTVLELTLNQSREESLIHEVEK
jgi:hypothetical protein